MIRSLQAINSQPHSLQEDHCIAASPANCAEPQAIPHRAQDTARRLHRNLASLDRDMRAKFALRRLLLWI